MKITTAKGHLAAATAMCLLIAGCQSTGGSADTAQLQQADLNVAETDPAAAGDPNAMALAEPAAEPQMASAGGQCSIQLAGGPPPIPPRGADFGKAFVKDTGKNVSRNIITMIGGRLGGGIGSAVASGVARSEIRPEGDIKGTWQITDGSNSCACTMEIGGVKVITGKGGDTGTIKTIGCSNPMVQQIANWALGYSFTGYDAKFELKARDKRTVLATLNRDGAHYFSGKMANGTPVVIWRDKQNYSSFKKTAAQ